VAVRINGKPAYISFISPTQLNVLAPEDPAEGPAAVEVINQQGVSEPLHVQKTRFAPTLFRFPAEGGKFAVAQSSTGDLLSRAGLMEGVATRPARPGEFVTLYGTGFGPTNPPTSLDRPVTQAANLANSVTVWIGDAVADVRYAGLIGSGIYQFNVIVPNIVDGEQGIAVEVGGVRSSAKSLLPVHR
jgi:uncharacterized protein (TIGR03437 family)